jgi:hypothetical protein
MVALSTALAQLQATTVTPHAVANHVRDLAGLIHSSHSSVHPHPTRR